MVLPTHTAADVINRAISILEAGPLIGDDAEHGPYCVLCAIARAQSKLNDEQDTGLSLSEAVIYFNDEVEADAPLVEARSVVMADVQSMSREDMESMTRGQAVRMLRDALDRLNPRTASPSSSRPPRPPAASPSRRRRASAGG